jgi:hypothetical protein
MWRTIVTAPATDIESDADAEAAAALAAEMQTSSKL